LLSDQQGLNKGSALWS